MTFPIARQRRSTGSSEEGTSVSSSESLHQSRQQYVQTVVSIDHDDFYVPSKPEMRFKLDSTCHAQFTPTESTRLPVVLFDTRGQQSVKADWIRTAVENVSRCGVYNDAFRSLIVLCNSKTRLNANLTGDARLLIKQWGSRVIQIRSSDTLMREGPFYMIGRSLHQVYKLYDDTFGAFTFGVVPDQDDPTRFHRFHDSRIPVPHAYYSFFPGTGGELAGMRIGVKDVLDIKGVPTTVSSRAYESLYGNAISSASVVENLVRNGAIIVGKTKTSQFASGESAVDWVDYLCPTNPRGDGSFAPNCSSTGSAAALAAYDWLDLSIGSDTLGSIVQPAFANGVFGFRPTQGRFESTGCLDVSSRLDTIGYFSRIPEAGRGLKKFNKVLYGSMRKEGECTAEGGSWAPRDGGSTIDEYEVETDSDSEYAWERRGPKFAPSSILYPSDMFADYPEQKKALMDGFVKEMLRLLAPPNHKVHFDIEQIWTTANGEVSFPPLSSTLSTTLAHIQLYDSYRNNEPFRSSYSATNGHNPLVNPMVNFKWNLGSKLTEDDYDQACQQQETFRKFLDAKVFADGPILILPASPPELAYRNDDFHSHPDERSHNLQGFGFELHQCSYLGGLPEIVIPVGQVPVTSARTGKNTFEPVSISIIGPRGSDHQLVEIVDFVWRRIHGESFKIKTGETAFEVKSAARPKRKREVSSKREGVRDRRVV